MYALRVNALLNVENEEDKKDYLMHVLHVMKNHDKHKNHTERCIKSRFSLPRCKGYPGINKNKTLKYVQINLILLKSV